jgi:type I restriction enzyme, S subunit
MRLEKLGRVTKNLDNKRIPLNSSQRDGKSKEGLYPYIGANNIMGYINEYIFDEKILCLAEDGGSWGNGQICANIYNEKCWVNNHAHVLTENGKANLEYLRYFLNKEDLNKYITGSTRGKLTKTALENILVPVPSLSDQLHIANLLSKAENLITQRKQSIALLDEFLKSTFLEMFGDASTNKMKWDKVELRKFGKIITGNTPPRNNDDNYSSDFIEWIKTDNISSDKTYITKAVEYLSESGLKGARTVENGALLIACIAGSIESVGRAAIANRTVSFNQQINAIQPNKDIEPLFLYWLFKISKKYVQNHATKGMKKILTKGEFEKILMIKPPLSLQTQFAQIVEKTETLKAHYQSSLQELENLYGSLSQRAFKGELTLNQAEEQVLMAAEPETMIKIVKIKV